MDQFFTQKLDDNTLDVLIGNWRRRFQGHKTNAINEISKFFIKCCGVEIDDVDVTNATSRNNLVAQVEAEMQGKPDYVPEGISTNDFHLNVIRYFTKLANSLIQILIDPMFKHFYKLLLDLSQCTSNSVRFITTIALCKMATQIHSSCLVHQNSSNISQMKNLSQDIVEKVFATQFKDGSWRVRLLIMKEIAIWFNEYHDSIDQEALFSYVIFNISDPAAAVRLECATIFNDLVSDQEEMPEYLLTIIHNKKDVLMNMAFESNYRIACAAITLITNISTLSPEIFTAEDHKRIMWNIYDPDPNVALQAAKFFCATCSTDQQTTIEKLKYLIHYFEDGLEFHPEIIGTVMYGEYEALSDFVSIANYLLETDDTPLALTLFKLTTHAALALNKQTSSASTAANKRKKRKTGNSEEDKSNFLRAFANCREEIADKYAPLDDEWLFTFEIFDHIYNVLHETELPDI